MPPPAGHASAGVDHSGIGFAFPDYDTVWKAMDGGLGAHLLGEIAKANLVVMEKIWDNGFRQTPSSTKPINGPDDAQGLQDPRAGVAALDLDVQGVRCCARLDQFQRGLFFSRTLAAAMTGLPGGSATFIAVSIVAFVILGSVLEGIPAIVLFGPLLFRSPARSASTRSITP